MRVSTRGAAALALAVLLLPVAAQADELLVMPYSCTMVGGQPLLTRGPEQGHRVLGQRDQRRFSACSPVNPDLCRQWTVQRFDLHCDGARVPWVSVVAATNEGNRRAWLLDGRLVLRMGPQWSLPPDDPCAREPSADRRFEYRRLRRYCADRLATAPPPVVEMPFGYAPMLGIDGIFVKATPSVAGGPQPLPPIAATPPVARGPASDPLAELFPPASQPERSSPTREPFADENPPRPALAAPAPVAAPRPQPAPKVGAATPPPAAAAPPPLAKAAPAESKPAAAEAKPAPRIAANAPAPKATVEAQPAPAPSSDIAKDPKTSTIAVEPAARETPKAVQQPAAPPRPAAEPEGGKPSLNLFSVFRTTTVGALVAFGGLALGLLTAFALARRNERIRDSRRRPRDLGSVSLKDEHAKPPARIGNARGNLPPNAAASAMSRVPGKVAANGSPEWGDRIPQTRAEAMQVLGIGVAPTANEAAIKKIVDGLRHSWHPDHAKDEADRVMRELRSKQINAAWELLRRQRAAV